MTIVSDILPMTAEQFLALPDNGMDRELIAGQLREKPMTVRNKKHSTCMAKIAMRLGVWAESRQEPRGHVQAGDAGFRLQDDTVVGIDVAYMSETASDDARVSGGINSGIPVLAVEILSPSDAQEDIIDKVDLYLRSGVQLVWIAEPRFKTITVYQPLQEPMLFNSAQMLQGFAALPGFSAAVSELFG